MCGRYALAPSSQQKSEQLRDVQQPAKWKIRYNIAPTQSAYVIAYSLFLESIRIVTGPSLSNATFMSAPNIPVSTGREEIT